MRNWRNVAAILWAVGFGLGIARADPASHGPYPTWFREVHTYNMNALLPEDAKELNITVNGIWGGIGGNDPILTHPPFVPAIGKKFGRDRRAFAEASHDAGLVVVAAIPTLEGMFTIREHTPNLEEMACRKADGSLALWSAPEEKCLQMCANNPDWLEWEIEFGKQGIDAGADLVEVDTPQGQAVGYMIQRGGFCSECMKTFEEYLNGRYTAEELEKKFGISEFKKDEIIKRLKDPSPGDRDAWLYANRIKEQPLFHEFTLCQEESGFETRKVLIDTLREYAESKGRKVVFACNAFQMGAGNHLGYWIRAIMFADVFDMFLYENGYSPHGILLEDVKPPRSKWAITHKLAHSIHGTREVAVMGAGALPRLVNAYLAEKPNPTTWMAVQCAEAYASNGAYSTYYFTPQGPGHPDGFTGFKEAFWEKAFDQFGYILEQRDLYEGALSSGSPVAFLFLYNDRGRTIPGVYPSYQGLAQGFVEGNYPFDVVFAGDGKYVKDRLTIDELACYRSVIVTSPIAPTENQAHVVQKFVESGGTLVCQDPKRLGFTGGSQLVDQVPYLAGSFGSGQGKVLVLKGDVTETWTDDIGSNFFRDYEPDCRTQILDLAERLGLSSTLTREPDGLVCAFPILQPNRGRIVVHLVNYDVDFEQDAIREKFDITVRVPRPVYFNADIEAKLYAAGMEAPQPLTVDQTSTHIECTVPRLGISADLVFAKGN
jgi:hypothetical protein